jgi:hypothetical protein
MKQYLPIVLVLLFLTLGVVLAVVSRNTDVREVLRFGISPNQLETPKIDSNGQFSSDTNTIQITTSDTDTEPTSENTDTQTLIPDITPIASDSETPTVQTTTKITTDCTGGYGQPCGEHVVVDTGLENEIFYALATLTYFGGMGSLMIGRRKIAR